MPLLGFGTWQITGREALQAVTSAVEAGYRHIDTATVYGNEREVGSALRAVGTDRESLFVTTKLPPHRRGAEPETLRSSLESLGTDHVDLWLIHWPPNDGVGIDLWKALIRARDEGLARDIGVSNYSLAQIEELVATTGVTPAVNQIEWSPKLFDAGILAGHREHLYQRLVVAGRSHREVAAGYIVATAVTGSLAIAWADLSPVLQALAIAALVAGFVAEVAFVRRAEASAGVGRDSVEPAAPV